MSFLSEHGTHLIQLNAYLVGVDSPFLPCGIFMARYTNIVWWSCHISWPFHTHIHRVVSEVQSLYMATVLGNFESFVHTWDSCPAFYPIMHQNIDTNKESLHKHIGSIPCSLQQNNFSNFWVNRYKQINYTPWNSPFTADCWYLLHHLFCTVYYISFI